MLSRRARHCQDSLVIKVDGPVANRFASSALQTLTHFRDSYKLQSVAAVACSFSGAERPLGGRPEHGTEIHVAQMIFAETA